MSEPKCPGCGAAVREDYPTYRRFECMTLEFDAFGPIQYELRESADCLRRQLAQRDERIGELEAERDQLRADLAALEARAMQLEEALKDVIQADIARQHGVPISVVDIAGKALEG